MKPQIPIQARLLLLSILSCTIPRINRYESHEHRKQREKEKKMRNQALLGQGGRDKVCFIYFNRTHRVRDCHHYRPIMKRHEYEIEATLVTCKNMEIFLLAILCFVI